MADFDICPDWVRPCEWPDLPYIAPDEEKIVGLVAVEDTDSEFLAILCEGDYIVDWGDGSEPELVASGVKAEHQYVYETVPGDPLCQDSSSSGYGGYKAVIVTITPPPNSSSSSSEGNSLTKVDIQQRHSALGEYAPDIPWLYALSTHQAKWLDIELNIPSCTELRIGPKVSEPFTTIGYPEEWPREEAVMVGWLKQVVLRAAALTSAYGLFAYCWGLSSVTLTGTENLTTTFAMFYRCFSLRKVPLFDTSAVTDMRYMFSLCQALVCVPLLNTAEVTTMERMFDYCHSLPTVPLLDTSAVLSMKGMFNYCNCLHTVPLFDTHNVSDMSGMFEGCECLPALPLFDTSAVTTMVKMCYYCTNLRSVPDFDTSAVTAITNIFYNCPALSSLPALSLAAVSSRTNASPFVSNCTRLTRSRVYGLRYAHSYISPKKPLTATALNEIFTNLGTAAGSQTITITNCLGAATCDRTIATAKGWTVTG